MISNKNRYPHIIARLQKLLQLYKQGKLGGDLMPEDSHPDFSLIPSKERKELQYAYFTFPMSLNYQRNSYKLWESALQTFNNPDTHEVFHISKVTKMPIEILRNKLLKYKLALQPNKHINTWYTIAHTINANWGSLTYLFQTTNFYFAKLKEIVQIQYKKGFPYISGPKIFNYWAYILMQYNDIKWKDAHKISIAPDTHIIQASVKLGIITKKQAQTLSREKIAKIWQDLLKDTGISPIQLHTPLWLWSRGGFKVQVK